MPGDAFYDLMDRLLEERVGQIHTSVIGEVIQVRATGNLDIQPIHPGYPRLIHVAVITPPENLVPAGYLGYRSIGGDAEYKEGDIVLVSFTERSRTGETLKKHGLEDGVVVGRLS